MCLGLYGHLRSQSKLLIAPKPLAGHHAGQRYPNRHVPVGRVELMSHGDRCLSSDRPPLCRAGAFRSEIRRARAENPDGFRPSGQAAARRSTVTTPAR